MLLKKNAILWSIISSNNFSNIDLKHETYHYWTDKCLELKNYSLDKDNQFESVKITITEGFTLIDFHTFKNAYMDSNVFYYGEPENPSPLKSNKGKISLGKFDIGLATPVDVTLTSYGIYGNYVGLIIYKKDWQKNFNPARN